MPSFKSYDWNFDNLEELIQARGDDVIVEKAVACTCRAEGTFGGMVEHEGAPANARMVGCRKCQGDGFIFRDARMVKGLITSVQAGPNRNLIDSGYALPGDSVFSPSLKTRHIGAFDRITFLFSQPIGDGQVIRRNIANFGDNALLNTGVPEDSDRLWYQAECSLWCEDQNGVVYTQEADFVLEDRLIRWTGNKPLDGVLYTIKYTGFSEWIVYNIPQDRVDRGRDLAQRVLIRRKHVAFNNGSLADTPTKRAEEAEEFSTRVKL